MDRSVVALVPCTNYEEESVYRAVAQGLNLLGGIEKFAGTTEKVLLKPNMLGKAEPAQAMTTHPAVFKAVGRLLRESGCADITYGDSPGHAFASLQKVADGCGFHGPAQEFSIPMGDFMHGRQVDFPQGRICKSFLICNGALEADAIINLCKMKTHALECVTGAVKNIYGCIPGVNKRAGHAKYPDAIRFARMLADLNKVLKPRLHIMDGIVAMEGNGPTSGTPTEVGVLLFSADPVALDSVFCHLIHVSPALIATCTAGEQAGIGHWREDEVQVLTSDGELSIFELKARYGKPGFQVRRSGAPGSALRMLTRLMPRLQDRPVASPDLCIKCGACVKSCPVDGKAIFLDPKQDKAPRYDYKKCIRCYCCQEMCPAKAIEVKQPLRRIKNAGEA